MAKSSSPPKDIPVFLFTGFLESGKTTFIQDTLEDDRFNDGEMTLLIICEEGEVEYDPVRFAYPNVVSRTIEDEEDLTEEKFESLIKETGATKVMIEYNGMWLLDELYNALPENWLIYQEFFFADARTILTYNTNMRQLTYDKLQSCELAVFNRFSPDMDQMEYHKLVRAASRRADIVYEAPDGNVTYDDIEDPLPFDINAPIIEIGLEDYALWYRDLSEDIDKYEGKTVKFTGRALRRKTLSSAFVVGRHVMTCCVEDIQFAGLVCNWDKQKVNSMPQDGWVTVTGKLHKQFHLAYGGVGPVLTATVVTPADAPEQEVATFY